MSEQREQCYKKLRKFGGSSVTLVQPSNVEEYILKDFPLHKGYPYLSQTHKADYLRTYFMHFYGGGYSDIKTPSGYWVEAFNDMKYNPTKLLNGYHEASEGCIANESVKEAWRELPGNCAYIVRPLTSFTQEWFDTMNALLDTKYDALVACDQSLIQPDSHSGNTQGYPLEWNEMLGRIFHKVAYKYRDQILFTVPPPLFTNYK
jgi:hypothetical protein